MKRSLSSLALFVTWLLFSMLVPAKAIRMHIRHEFSSQGTASVDEQLMNKLYDRVHKKIIIEERELKRDIDLLAEYEREIDRRIKEARQQLIELRTAQTHVIQNNAEIKLKENYVIQQAQNNAVFRNEAEEQIKALRAQRTSNDAQLEQYNSQMRRLSSDIERLSEYPLTGGGVGWNTQGNQTKTIPEVKQFYHVELSKVQTEGAVAKQKYATWEASKTSDNLTALRAYLIAYAETQGATCVVDIKSQKNSSETTDATVKYQTPEQRQYGARPKPAKSKTKCLGEKMKPNRYYMWTERNGNATSSRDELFPIGSEKEEVTLMEN